MCCLALLTCEVSAQEAVQDDTVFERGRASRLYVRGLTRARNGDHESALDLYADASRLAPREPAILLSMSESHLALKHIDRALFYAEQAAALNRSRPYVHHLARMQVLSGNTELALKTYRELTSADSTDTDAMFEMARLLVHQGKDAEAAEAFENLLNVLGDDRVLRTQLLQLYGRLEDHGGIERTLRALIRLRPQSAQYYLLLADALKQTGNIDAAIDVLVDGTTANPNSYDLTSELISLYRSSGKTDRADSLAQSLADVSNLTPEQITARAEQAYLRASSDPSTLDAAVDLLERAVEVTDDTSLQIMLGDLYYARGEFEGAARLLAAALEREPRNVDLWVQTSLARLNAGDLEGAGRTAEEGLILFPGRAELAIIAGHATLRMNRNSAAIDHFEYALELISDDEHGSPEIASEAHAALGLLYSRRRDNGKSDMHYRAALVIDSTNVLALNNLAYSLAERNENLTEALSLAKKALELDAENASFLDTAGWIYYLMGNLAEAKDLIAKAVASGSASAVVHEHLGDIEHDLGNHEEARAHWTTAQQMDPDNPRLKTKLADTASDKG